MRTFLINASEPVRFLFIAAAFLVLGLLGLAVAIFLPLFGFTMAGLGFCGAVAYTTGAGVLCWWEH